ncbi:MAG TPA: hypothetical protein DEV93_23295 [Chloroflexi bacterium]|nr:hypothetical protein [Chloroflexota bacterium]
MAEGRQRRARGGTLRVFFLAFVVFAYFMPQWADWNIDSRLDLVHALVDGHTVRIDRYHFNTWDKAKFKGHFYSDKAPGTAVMGAAVYGAYVLAKSAPLLGGGISALQANSAWNTAIALGRTDTQLSPAKKGRVLGGCQRSGIAGNVQVIPWNNRLYPPFRDWALSKYVTSVGLVALFSAVFIALFFWFLGKFAIPPLIRWGATSLYAFATVALPYSTVLYSHQLVAGFLFTAFALLYLRSRGEVGAWSPPVAGLLLGLSIFTEYTIVIVVAAIGLYALWLFRRSYRSAVALCAAAAVPVAGLMVYNAASFGNPLDTGYSHDFCWSSAQAAGIAGFTYPHLGPLWDLTFGSYRGLFFMSPWLLLGISGVYVLARSGFKIEAGLCAAIGLIFIVTISAYWGWNGGRTDGPRYLVPIVPFLAFLGAFGLEAAWWRKRTRLIAAVLAVWSAVVTWALFLGGQQFPISWLRNPLFDYSLPALRHGVIESNAGMFLGLSSWASLIPLALLILLILAWRPPSELLGRGVLSAQASRAGHSA